MTQVAKTLGAGRRNAASVRGGRPRSFFEELSLSQDHTLLDENVAQAQLVFDRAYAVIQVGLNAGEPISEEDRWAYDEAARHLEAARDLRATLGLR